MTAPTTPIKLVVGLGNPGAEYEKTRHNAGFWFAEDVAHEIGGTLNFEKKFSALVARGAGVFADVRVALPQTFMNLSGTTVAAMAKFYDIESEAILVAHDELDLLAGETKLKFGGGHAGHNGLRDIHAKLGTSNYWRLRVGIGHPRDSTSSQKPVVDWVLERPRREEQSAIEAAIERALAVWPHLAAGKTEIAGQQLHTKPQPSKQATA